MVCDQARRCRIQIIVPRWQSQSSVVSMLDQVQRIQIRRIERDTFEADELIKRCLALLYRRRGDGRSPSGGSSSGSDGGRGGRGGGGVARQRGSVVSRPGSIKPSTRRSSGTGGRFREVEETEIIRKRQDSGAKARTGEASNTGRRRRSTQSRYEYEVVQSGRIYIDVEDGGRQDGVEYVEPVRNSVPLRDLSRERRRD